MYGNLKIFRESLGMTQKEFAASLSIGSTTYNGYETGARDPKSDFWISVATKYGVTIDYLMGYSDDPHKTSDEPHNKTEISHIEKYRSLDDYGQEAVDSVLDVEYRRCEKKREADKQEKILAVKKQKDQMEAAGEIAPKMVEKLIYVYPAAAGNPLYAESDFERLEFPEDSIPYGADFGIRISGKSMEPTIKDGAIVWVHKVLDLEDGTVGVFMLNDSAVCKRFYRDKWRNVRLESDNPEFCPVEVGEFDTFRIVGKVVGSV